MSKKILICALAAAAAIGTTSSALANNINGTGLYVGADVGYGDTHWRDFDSSDSFIDPVSGLVGTESIDFKSQGIAGRIYAGYDFTQFFGVETGFTYFPETDVTATVNVYPVFAATAKTDFKTYGYDLLAKISVPVCERLSVFAKAGPGYLRTDFSDGKSDNVDLVYGFGASYDLTRNLAANASFLRYNGNYKVNTNNAQPNADLYSVGLSYKFDV